MPFRLRLPIHSSRQASTGNLKAPTPSPQPAAVSPPPTAETPFNLLALPVELIQLVADFASTRDARALSLCCKRLCDVVGSRSSSSREFLKVRLPHRFSCGLSRDLLGRFLCGLDGVDINPETMDADSKPIERLMVIVPAWSLQSTPDSLEVYDNKRGGSTSCKRNHNVTLYLGHPEQMNRRKLEVEALFGSVKELRVLIELSGRIEAQDVGAGGSLIIHPSNLLVSGLIDVLGIKQHLGLEGFDRVIQVQQAIRGPGGEIRVFASDLTLYYPVNRNSFGPVHFINKMRLPKDSSQSLQLPDDNFPTSEPKCRKCRTLATTEGVCHLQSFSIISRVPYANDEAPARPRSLKNSINAFTATLRPSSNRPVRVPNGRWDSLPSVHLLHPMATKTRLSHVHFEGVSLEIPVYNYGYRVNFLQFLCPHVSRLVLRNCHLVRITWCELFHEAVTCGTRTDACELDGLSDKENLRKDGGCPEDDLRYWEQLLMLERLE